ncbi:MAG: class GN sortase [Myxococcota bacterium]
MRGPDRGGRLRPAAIALIAASALALGHGLWIPAKALLAQQLIERAWRLAEPGAPPPRPWPWADTGPIARLWLSPDARPLYVLAGASGEAMAFGPAHVSSSARPEQPDNVAIAGHRDTHFAALQDLASGDRLRLESVEGTVRDYEVVATRVVHASRGDLLERSGVAELTLITCFPFDAVVPGGSDRFVVHARAIETKPAFGRR